MNDLVLEYEPSQVGMFMAEMDQRVGIARRYPRQSRPRIMEEIMEMATSNEDVATECIYSLKRGGKLIIGPSARFAEIVSACYGNAEYAAKVTDEGAEFVTAQAMFHDLQANTKRMIEVKRRITDSNNVRYGVDMVGVTSMAAISIALRNVTLQGVPRAVWGPVYEKCLALTSGTFESIEKRRTSALDAYKKLGVEQALVLELLDRKRVDEIEPDDMIVLRGTLQAIKDGDTTVNQVFGAVQRKANQNAKADIGGHLDKGRASAEAESTKTKSGSAAGTGDAQSSKAGSGAGGAKTDSSSGAARSGSEPSGRSVDAGTGGGDDADGSGNSSPEERGGDAGAGQRGSDADAQSSPVEIAPDFAAVIGATELSAGETLALEKLARALQAAETSVQVTQATAPITALLEAGSEALQEAVNKMVAIANKAVRARKKAPGSAASRL